MRGMIYITDKGNILKYTFEIFGCVNNALPPNISPI
jgi:hypothetical protein